MCNPSLPCLPNLPFGPLSPQTPQQHPHTPTPPRWPASRHSLTQQMHVYTTCRQPWAPMHTCCHPVPQQQQLQPHQPPPPPRHHSQRRRLSHLPRSLPSSTYRSSWPHCAVLWQAWRQSRRQQVGLGRVGGHLDVDRCFVSRSVSALWHL